MILTSIRSHEIEDWVAPGIASLRFLSGSTGDEGRTACVGQENK